MRTVTTLLAGLAFATGTAAIAQTAAPAAAATAGAQLKAGATIYDTSGTEVGTIESVAADAVLVSTGTNKLAIPPASFGAGAKGPVLAATRVQLDAAATQAADAAKTALMAKLVPGAEVRGVSGQTVLGSVKSVEGDLVLVTTPKGDVRVPSNIFSAGPAGLVIAMSAADFDTAVAAAKATS